MPSFASKAGVFLALIVLPSSPCLAGTVLIHAVGLASGGTSNPSNHPSFYQGARDFVSYCQSRKLQLGLKSATSDTCHLFIDSDAPGIGSNAYRSHPRQRDVILSTFERALENAGPGDQVVFSLHDHGGPGAISSSCVSIGDNWGAPQLICKEDIEKILSKKKPGVKVFLAMNACFSGAFTKLTSKDVCTWTASDQATFGVTSDSFWTQLNALSKGAPVTLEEFRLKWPWFASNARRRFGGFGSQRIHDSICRAEGGSVLPMVARLPEWPMSSGDLLSPTLRMDSLFAGIEESAKGWGRALSSCTQASGAFQGAWKAAKDVSEVIGYLAKSEIDLPKLIADSCSNTQNDGGKLCKALTELNADLPRLREASARIRSLLEAFERKRSEFLKFDAEIMRKSTGAAVEALRGSLLDGLNGEIRALGVDLEKMTSVVSLGRVVENLQYVHERFCVNNPGSEAIEGDFPLSFNQAWSATWTLSAFKDQSIPRTQKALEDAQQCERNFELP